MENKYTIETDRPAAEVWSILFDDYASVGDWATGVPSSRPDDSGEGRYNATPFRFFGEVHETLIAHNNAAMTFTYTASSVPRWIGRPNSSWFVEPLGENRCRAGFHSEIDATTVGKLILRLSRFDLEELAGQVLGDLKHFAETGRPSPAKQATLAPASSPAPSRV